MEGCGNNEELNTGVSWRIAAGLLAPLLFFILVFVLGALEPGFDHKALLMSRLGGVPPIADLKCRPFTHPQRNSRPKFSEMLLDRLDYAR